MHVGLEILVGVREIYVQTDRSTRSGILDSLNITQRAAHSQRGTIVISTSGNQRLYVICTSTTQLSECDRPLRSSRSIPYYSCGWA